MNKSTLIRFEKKVARLWEDGKIRVPIHLSGGNEEELIDIFKRVRPHDYVFSTHRNHYHYLLKGGNEEELLKEIVKEDGALCEGMSGSMHTTDTRIRFYSSAIVAGCCGIAVGVAWALKREAPTGKVKVWCFVGDGALDEGHFWEALAFAQAMTLPIWFVVEDNNRATCSSVEDRFGARGRQTFGEHAEDLRSVLRKCRNVIYYDYEATWPHVGTGKYVQF